MRGYVSSLFVVVDGGMIVFVSGLVCGFVFLVFLVYFFGIMF